MTTTPEIIVLPDGRMDRQNAARYLGLASRTLAQWASRGTGPKFIKRGRVWYRREDLDAWINDGQGLNSAPHLSTVE